MVLGYMCETHGYQRECDVGDDGERICQECGMAVTGVTGRTRSSSTSPPTDKPGHTAGDISWSVMADHGRRIVVDAFDHEQAAERAADEVDNPQSIKEIVPEIRAYRH